MTLRRRGLDWLLNAYAGLALIYLLVPIAVIIVFSFNNPTGRFNFLWNEFSFDAWKDPFGVPGIGDALRNSLEIAALSTLFATILGTITALALVRYEFKGRAPVNFFIFIPLATPEVVLGAALLSQFLNLGTPQLGFITILIAHIMFNLSFVVITVRSRLIGFDRSLEEAAQDLGATPWETFRLVTLPLIMPGVVSAALLAFALSIDDFVITYFNNGSTITFPLFIWGAARVAIPPQIYVIATMIFLFTVAMMLITVWQQRRAEKMAASAAGRRHRPGRLRPACRRPSAGVTTAQRAQLAALIERERDVLRASESALARAALAGAREPARRRPDVVDGDVGGRLPALPGARPRRHDRRRGRPRVRRLLPRRHRRDGRPLAGADDAGHRRRSRASPRCSRPRTPRGWAPSWRAASGFRTGSSRSRPRTPTAG